MAMKRTLIRASVLAAFVACSAGCSLTAVADRHDSGTEAVLREIWQLEQQYWERNQAADHEKIAAMWHEEFLGWPRTEAKPVDKKAAKDYVRRRFTTPYSYTFAIEPAAARVHGDVVLNYYTVRLTSKDKQAPEKTTSLRIVHTWLRDGDTWRILGGMSSSF